MELVTGSQRRVVKRAAAHDLARDVVIVNVVALALGLVRLDRPSLWVDESFTAHAVAGSYLSLMTDQYHWLYYSLMKPWTAAVGTSEWMLRIPSVLGAMLACTLLVILGRRVFDRWVALLAGLFLASSPFVLKWAQQARGYTLLLALTLLATLLLLRALERGSRRRWAAYGLALAAVVVWHPVVGLLLIPSQVVLTYQGRSRITRHALLAAVIVCVVGLPWAGQIAIRSTGERASINWLEAPTADVVAKAVLDVSGAAGLGVVLGALGMIVLWVRHRRASAAWLATWATAPFVVSVVVSAAKPIFLDRYLMVAAPAFALLSAVAIMGVGRRLSPVFVVCVIAATALSIAHWYSLADEGNWRGEDWRSAVATVSSRRNETDAVVVAPWSAAPAARYYGATVVDVSTADSIWVITWSEAGDDITDAERSALGFGDHELVEKLQFGRRVSAQLWRRPR